MNEGQRSQCLKRFNVCRNRIPWKQVVEKGRRSSARHLNPTAEDASLMLSIPVDSVRGIWKKEDCRSLCRFNSGGTDAKKRE